MLRSILHLDFEEFKANTAERNDKIKRLMWKNVIGHDTVQTKDMKQQVELLQNENNAQSN